MNSPLTPLVVIPALKKHAAIPDQLVKKLAGVTLIQRAINTAKAFCEAASAKVGVQSDILVITDSQEIGLICQRNGVRFHCNPALHFQSLDIAAELRELLAAEACTHNPVLIYRASCPLLRGDDLLDAYTRFMADTAPCMISVKNLRRRVWEAREGQLNALLVDDDDKAELLMESRALILLRAQALQADANSVRVVPYFLNDRAVEINGYQDWWICERLLERRHVVFVVAGYPAIGMGHIYRALMLAHEVTHHKITFMCTKESELAASSIAARDYRTCIQQHDALADDVLALQPDLVVNDILNTSAEYVRTLQRAGAAVVNFEDKGTGADEADLVVNALYEPSGNPRVLAGAKYFCLRDEFLQAERNTFRPAVRRVLITFGGTDMPNFTRQTLEVVEPLCRGLACDVRVVVGPGYAHKDDLEQHIAALDTPHITFTCATNAMSSMMEGVDLAVTSAGRTVYELAHMRIPAIVLAQHAREGTHTFARAPQGFAYLGVMLPFQAKRLKAVFLALVQHSKARQKLYNRMQAIDFTPNKASVVQRILKTLKCSE